MSVRYKLNILLRAKICLEQKFNQRLFKNIYILKLINAPFFKCWNKYALSYYSKNLLNYMLHIWIIVQILGHFVDIDSSNFFEQWRWNVAFLGSKGSPVGGKPPSVLKR